MLIRYTMIAVAQLPFTVLLFGALLYLLKEWNWFRVIQFAGSALLTLGLLLNSLTFDPYVGLAGQHIWSNVYNFRPSLRMLLDLAPAILTYFGLVVFSLGYFLGAVTGRKPKIGEDKS